MAGCSATIPAVVDILNKKKKNKKNFCEKSLGLDIPKVWSLRSGSSRGKAAITPPLRQLPSLQGWLVEQVHSFK